jgi:hypothetical protein
VLKVLENVDSPVSRIPVMHVSSSTPKSDQIFKKVGESPGLESALMKIEALEDQESESDDKGSEITLQDEFEEPKEINLARDADPESENAAKMFSGLEIDSNGEKDLRECLEEEHNAENQSKDILTAVCLPEEIAPQAINLESRILLSAQSHDDLVSDFVNDILDKVTKSYEPDDSQILSYINDILNEVVEELEMSHKQNFSYNLDKAIIKAPVAILKVAPAAEALEQWHIPSKSGSPEMKDELMSVEPWYVPSWTEKSCETVTMNNLPDILTTLRSSVIILAKL